jgi:hypothetical protein
MHLRVHVFDDIQAKGATRNYNTKVNENLHGPIKDFYEQVGNGKDVDKNVSGTATILIVNFAKFSTDIAY